MRLLRRPELRILALVAIARRRLAHRPPLASSATPAAEAGARVLDRPGQPGAPRGRHLRARHRRPAHAVGGAARRRARSSRPSRPSAAGRPRRSRRSSRCSSSSPATASASGPTTATPASSTASRPTSTRARSRLLERNPEVAGVYPVRVAYPAAISAARAAAGVAPGVGAARFDGSGVPIALLDTGVDLTHPYLGRPGRARESTSSAGRADGRAQPNPQNREQLERHGTELAGVLVGSGGPRGLHGVAPGATRAPDQGRRLAGRRRSGRDAVFARSDQLIAGLDRAVDPNGDGDAHDAARIALLGVAEPFASFADSPEAAGGRRCGRARHARRRRRPATTARPGPLFGSIAGPGGSPVGARGRGDRLRARRPRPRGSSSTRESPCSRTRRCRLLGAVGPERPARGSTLARPRPARARSSGKAALVAGRRRTRRRRVRGRRRRRRRGRAPLRPRAAGRLARRRRPSRCVGVPESTAAPVAQRPSAGAISSRSRSAARRRRPNARRRPGRRASPRAGLTFGGAARAAALRARASASRPPTRLGRPTASPRSPP